MRAQSILIIKREKKIVKYHDRRTKGEDTA